MIDFFHLIFFIEKIGHLLKFLPKVKTLVINVSPSIRTHSESGEQVKLIEKTNPSDSLSGMEKVKIHFNISKNIQ